MKKKILVALFSLFVCGFVFAQVSTTPEVPRNYKPKPKELIPMPDSLTIVDIFPVLGKYKVLVAEGDSTVINIAPDAESKGVVWVSGLPQGKFKADLKASPAIYKVLPQKTLLNDEATEETVSDDAAATSKKEGTVKLSGKTIQEGTLIYDKETNTLYINMGTKFNEKDPASVFPALLVTTETVTETQPADAKKTKAAKGINYTGSKIIESSASISQ